MSVTPIYRTPIAAYAPFQASDGFGRRSATLIPSLFNALSYCRPADRLSEFQNRSTPPITNRPILRWSGGNSWLKRLEGMCFWIRSALVGLLAAVSITAVALAQA